MVGAAQVTYNDTTTYEAFKKLMTVLRQLLTLAFWILSYFYLKKLELTFKKDINRRDYGVELIEVIAINSSIWILGMLVGFCLGPLLIQSKPLLIVACTIGNLSILYMAFWFVGLFWRGFFTNSELTPEEANAPMESSFVMIFYVFARVYSVLLFIIGLSWIILQPFFACTACVALQSEQAKANDTQERKNYLSSIKQLGNAMLVDSNNQCTICLNKFSEGDELVKLECGHMFHF